jgi:hypothetical protein
MRLSSHRTRWALGLIAVIAAIAVFICVRFVEFYRVTRLYENASDHSKWTGERLLAIRKLTAYSSAYSTELLLRLAMDARPLVDTRVRVEAVAALANRRETDVSGPLASLMAPHNSPMLRQSVSFALKNMPCSSECVDWLLQYLYRIRAGEGYPEDFYQRNSSSSEDFAAEEQEINKKLEEILIREKATTLGVLGKVYGFGSDTPSPFAIHMLGQLHFKEACESLTRIHIEAVRDSATRTELQTTLDALGCPVRS